jgi:Uma2 family endonuclease
VSQVTIMSEPLVHPVPETGRPSHAGDAAPALDREEKLYEIVDGKRVKKPPMSVVACLTASRLLGKLGGFVAKNHLGEVVCEMLFRLPLPADRSRRPNVAFVSEERWPPKRRVDETAEAWDVVPDLAVEVISPSNTAVEIQGKLHEYFQAGVALVWIVYPRQQVVYVYTAATRVTILDRNGELDGGTVVPGFKLPVAALFEDEPQATPG